MSCGMSCGRGRPDCNVCVLSFGQNPSERTQFVRCRAVPEAAVLLG